MKLRSTDSTWISFSDIMTGLMVIFMFIAIAYISQVNKSQSERDELFEEFKKTKEDLYNELDSTFHDDFKDWNVELDRDLSIKFTNPDILFESNEWVLKPRFQSILEEFLPPYFDIILKDKYRDRIAEIRIEGHTDDIPAYTYDSDAYIGNVKLSQRRAAEVLKFFRTMDYYQGLSRKKEADLKFWLTANGLSYGRTLDSNKELTRTSGRRIDRDLSRRVEFRIVTASEKIVDKVIEQIEGE